MEVLLRSIRSLSARQILLGPSHKESLVCIPGFPICSPYEPADFMALSIRPSIIFQSASLWLKVTTLISGSSDFIPLQTQFHWSSPPSWSELPRENAPSSELWEFSQPPLGVCWLQHKVGGMLPYLSREVTSIYCQLTSEQKELRI